MFISKLKDILIAFGCAGSLDAAWGLLFVVVCGFPVAVASLVVKHESRFSAFSGCGTRAWLPPACGIFPNQGSA